MKVTKLSTTFALFAAMLFLGASAIAQTVEKSNQPVIEKKQISNGYDARLSHVDYPYETKTFTFEAQGHQLEMVYMDVQPEVGLTKGEAVLLLHGKNFSGAYWANTIAPLLRRGYRVVVPDQIGFGKSSKPECFQYTFHGLATYTFNLLNSLGIERIHVIGHSMGGMLATRFALMFPGHASSLTLVNPIGLEDWKLKVPYRPVEWWFEQELAKTPEKVRTYMTASYFDGVWKPQYEPLVDLQVGWIKGPDYRQIAKSSALTYDMIFTQPVVYEFGLVKVPTLLIIGTRDRTALGKGLVSDEVRKTLGIYDQIALNANKAIPNSQLELLDGIGHIPQYEAFDKYMALLTAFLADTKPAH